IEQKEIYFYNDYFIINNHTIIGLNINTNIEYSFYDSNLQFLQKGIIVPFNIVSSGSSEEHSSKDKPHYNLYPILYNSSLHFVSFLCLNNELAIYLYE